MSAITLRKIRKSFGDTQVLKGVDLSIRQGEFLTLVGPSGCGKSTLLRILAGLETADTGTVEIGGRDVTDIRAADRDLAMVFQSYALYPHLSVAENMMTPLKLRDLNFWQRPPILGPILSRESYRALTEQVRETAEVLQIGPLLDRKPGQLSGGQRQRAALARAMVRNPVAFLMDEPLSNLDAALRVHMRAELSELHRRLGTTFVYVTHDQAEALTMSDRMAVMRDGNILQLGLPDAIYDDPDTLEVARFVGSPAINVLPAELDETGALRVFGRRLAVFRSDARRPVTLGVRSEHLDWTEPGRGDFDITLRHRENLGADIYLHGNTIDGGHNIILRYSERSRDLPGVGATVGVLVGAHQALMFDSSGARLRLPARDRTREIA